MKMKNDGTGKWYVSRYDYYPIYEPAEGGYYYNGTSCVETYVFNTRKKAMRFLLKLIKHYMDDSENLNDYPLRWNGFDRENTYYSTTDHTYFSVESQYVGEGFFWQLERTIGESEYSYEPYC